MLSALKPVRATLRHFSNLLLAIHRLLLWFSIVILKYEPPHDKTNKVSVHPAKTQISLGIRPVWSETSLSAWRKLGSLAIHLAHSEDSDQTGRMPRLIWVFAGRTATLLVLSRGGSYLFVLVFLFALCRIYSFGFTLVSCYRDVGFGICVPFDCIDSWLLSFYLYSKRRFKKIFSPITIVSGCSREPLKWYLVEATSRENLFMPYANNNGADQPDLKYIQVL